MENEEMKMEETLSAAVAEDAAQTMMTMDEMQRQQEQMKLRQNMPKGVVASIVVGLVCAVLWAFITAITHYQIGYMAWGVGLAVGATMKAAGKGLSPIYGVVASVIALASCVVGNFLSYIAFFAVDSGMYIWEILSGFDYSLTLELMDGMFSPIDVIFYILAVCTAFGIGFIRERKA